MNSAARAPGRARAAAQCWCARGWSAAQTPDIERLITKTRHLADRGTVRKRAIRIAVLDDILRQHLIQTRHPFKQRSRRRIDVHTDSVHTIFDGGIQRSCQRLLVHIVLILTDADGLGIDLHQLCQRVLQTTGNGNGPAQTDIQFGKLSRSKGRR